MKAKRKHTGGIPRHVDGNVWYYEEGSHAALYMQTWLPDGRPDRVVSCRIPWKMLRESLKRKAGAS